ncbi:MAG: hypothetical protein RLZZ184_4077, partial [Cyanobacteriota bacterium]
MILAGKMPAPQNLVTYNLYRRCPTTSITPLKLTAQDLTARTREKIDLEYLPIFLYKFP